MNDLELDSKYLKTMDTAMKEFFPWIKVEQSDNFSEHIEIDSFSILNQFYLLDIQEITIGNEEEDIFKYINNRYNNVLTAAYMAGITVGTCLIGDGNKVSVMLGVLPKDNSYNEVIVFKKIVQGVFPGIKIRNNINFNMSDFVKDKNYRGLLCGIPTLKIENEKQKFSISAIARSMYGEKYALFMISKPVNANQIKTKLSNVLKMREECHKLAFQNITIEKGEGENSQIQISEAISESDTKGVNVNLGSVGAAIGALVGSGAGVPKTLGLSVGMTGPVPTGNISIQVPFGLAARLQGAAAGAVIGNMLGSGIGGNYSKTKTKQTSVGHSVGKDRHWSESVSYEQQNGLAIEMEKVAENLIERLKIGLNTGCWETIITFASNTDLGRDVLAGSFYGELAKPNADGIPPKIFYLDANTKNDFIVPKGFFDNENYECDLSSCLNTQELSFVGGIPFEKLPGFEIRQSPIYSLSNVTEKSIDGFSIGNVCDLEQELEGNNFTLSEEELNKHTFVTGITGSGKTSTVKTVLRSTKVPFLVLESAKRDYRQLMAEERFKDELRVYTVGESNISPIRINPFYILPGVSPQMHIDFLKDLFQASFSFYGPMPYILEKCIHNVYIKKGWNLTKGEHPFFINNDGSFNNEAYHNEEHYFYFPTMNNLIDEVNEFIKTELDYKGEVSDNIRTAIITRLESLAIGSKGFMFNTKKMIDIEELLLHPTIFEMEFLSDDSDKAFFVGLVLTFISEYRQVANQREIYSQSSRNLKHILIIEEAHRLLKNIDTEKTNEMLGNPKGKAVETFCNIISEMRSYGQGVIVVEQIPSKIARDVIKNSNNKIIHRLVSKDDQNFLANTVCVREDESIYFGQLKTGYAVCHKEGMTSPTLVKVKNTSSYYKISDEAVNNRMIANEAINKNIKQDIEIHELRTVLSAEGDEIAIRFINSLLTLSEEQYNSLFSMTEQKLTSLCKKRTSYFNYSSEILYAYLIDKVCDIFSSGIYNKGYIMPDDIFIDIKSLIIGRNKNKIFEFKNKFAEYFEYKNSEEFIVDVVSTLVFNLIYSELITANEAEDYKNLIKQYFVIEDNNIIEGIYKIILKRVRRRGK